MRTKSDDYHIHVCFEGANRKNPVGCNGHLEELHGCPYNLPGVCHVWFKGISSVPLIKFNIMYATLCEKCLVNALRCNEYEVEQVSFFKVKNIEE